MAEGSDDIEHTRTPDGGQDRNRGEGRHAAPDDVWAAVREDYLEGMSAPECCYQHGVGLSALRQRAARGGWRRADVPWTPPNRLDPNDEGVVLEEQVGGDLNKVEPCQLTFIAHRRMLRAVMRGDAAEALRWRRVELVMEAVEAESDRLIAQQEAVWHHLYGPHTPTDPDAVHSVHGSDAVHSVHSVHASDGVSASGPTGPDPARPSS